MSRPLYRAALIAAAAGFVLASSAHAQDSDPGSEAPDGPIEQAGRLPGERVQVEAGTADGSASISFSLLDRSSRTTGNQVMRFSTDTLNLIVSTPWNGEDDAMPATLDGLANGTKVTFRWGHRVGFLNAVRTDSMRQIEAEARVACRVAAEQAYQNRLSTAESAVLDDADPNALQRRRQVLEREREQALDGCAFPPGGWGNLIDEHLEDRSADYIATLRPRGSYEFGLEASVGRNGFEYVDPATLAELEDSKVQWSARAYFTYFPLGSQTAFSLTAGYQRAYSDADEAVLCPANPTNVVIRCTTAPAGPPELEESALISAGLRHRFGRGFLSNFAVAPVVTYDFTDDVVGVDLPVYFVPNSDGGLTGGIRFGYRSDRDDEFSVGIFIGAAFNFLR